VNEFEYCVFEADTRIDREGAAAIGILVSFSQGPRTRHGDWENDRCDSFLRKREGREKRFPSQRRRETVHQRSRVLSFPRDAHYANGNLPSRLSTDRILNVISFLSSSKSKGGAFCQRRRQDNASIPKHFLST